MSAAASPQKRNKFIRFKDPTVMRIGSIVLAVAVLLFVGFFGHFTRASSTQSSPATINHGTSTNDNTAPGKASGQNNPSDPVSKKSANGVSPDARNIHGAVLSGSSLVYKIDKPAREREPIILTLFANDPDGDILTYSATNLPEGADFDPATRTFSWTPRYNQAGSYTVSFQVSDGQASDSEDVTINVIKYGENWDVNVDSHTNILDIVLVGQHWNENGQTAWIKEDCNEDGTINVLDMIVIGQHWTG